MRGIVRRHGLLQGQGLDFGRYTLAYAEGDRTMVRVLADRAADRPDKDWIVFDSSDRLTFGATWTEACRIGHAFDRDLPAGAHVGLLMRNQPEFLLSFYGALVRGSVAVPFNAEARGPLLEAVIEHSDVQAIVVRDELVERLTGLDGLGQVSLVVVAGDGEAPDEIHGARVVRFDDWRAGLPSEHAWPFPLDDTHAAIMYTSGTTARPKGAVYTHQYLYLYASLGCDSQDLTEDDVLTAPLPLYHAAALHVISNSCMHTGGTGHLKTRFSASQYWQQCADDGSTWGVLLGPMSTMILKMTQDPVPAHRMKRIYCPPPPPDLEQFERRFAVKIMWWGFGMTEIFPMPPVLPELHDRSLPMDTIGRPSRWVDYGVVDEHDRLRPPNEIGALVFRPCIPHAMVTEYYKDPERTVEAFRNLMFHTGDLASYDDDGILHFHGRRQERIRRRGENVSAAELEWVVMKHECVLDAAAYGVPSPLGEEDVKLDVVLRDELTIDALHGWLQENLPRYMVPRYLEIRESFPKTPSERIEKYRLKEDPLDRPAVFDAERDTAEKH
jgi:carnitine-CoA ligase